MVPRAVSRPPILLSSLLLTAAACAGNGVQSTPTSIPPEAPPATSPPPSSTTTVAPATTSTTAAPSTTAATTTSTAPPTTTTTTAPATTTAAGPRVITIAAAGDVLIHRALANVAAAHSPEGEDYDFVPLMSAVEPWVAAADLAICHMEGTLSPDNTGLLYQDGFKHPARFNAPREVADALVAVGWDACSTASNHATDRGSDGIADTLHVLDLVGLGHSGTARNEEERGPAFYEVKGVTIGHLSYTFGLNSSRAGDRPWEVNVMDQEAILADAAVARSAGADFVILSLHWGIEYTVTPSQAQQDQAQRLLASPDLDLILGHHAHVVQPIDWIDGEVVVYGMGNHLSNIRGLPDGRSVGGEDGVIVEITITEQEDGTFAATGVRFTPTWVHHSEKAVLPVADTLISGDPALAGVLQASWNRTLERLLAFEPIEVFPTAVP